MKKILLTAVLAFIGVWAFAQERIAVFPFEDMENMLTRNEAVMFYREFSNEFTNKSAGRFSVVPRQEVERLINTEAAFQLSDFSARTKTAEMQRVLNGTQILSGLIGKLGNNIRITVSLYTYPELVQLPGGTTLSVANKTELFSKIPELVRNMQNEIAGGSSNRETGKVLLDSDAMREQFNGDWIGTDTRLQINGNRIIQYFKDNDGTWYPISPRKQFFLYDRNNLVYIWLNMGGVWSETQVFSLSNVDKNTLDLVWNRHVNNIADKGDNDVWNVDDHQILIRAGSSPSISSPSLSQSNNQTIPAQFHGSWIGTVNVNDSDAVVGIGLVVTASRITQYFQNDDGSWRELIPASSSFSFERNNLVYVWLNKGGIWTETQVYSLSLVNSSSLNIVWSRHVNNYMSDEPVNETWHIGGEGLIRKQ
jgi:TolB-like protein